MNLEEYDSCGSCAYDSRDEMYAYDSQEEQPHHHHHQLPLQMSLPTPQPQNPQQQPLQRKRLLQELDQSTHGKKGNKAPKKRMSVKDRIQLINSDDALELELLADCSAVGTHTPSGPCSKHKTCRRGLLDKFMTTFNTKNGKKALKLAIRTKRWDIVNCSDQDRISR